MKTIKLTWLGVASGTSCEASCLKVAVFETIAERVHGKWSPPG